MRRPSELVTLGDTLARLFGADSDPIEAIDRRARQLFPDQNPVVWEGDAATFQFTFVSPSAVEILGHPRWRWTDEPTFWADVIVHSEDREEAIAYCALATARCRDHAFEYRAVSRDGRVVWLKDIVRVIQGRKGVPVKLRGVMFDITAEKTAAGTSSMRPSWQEPSRAELDGASP